MAPVLVLGHIADDKGWAHFVSEWMVSMETCGPSEPCCQ